MPLTALDRKAELVRTGSTMSEIARDLGISPNHVSKVIAGERRSPRVEEAVAQRLGLPVSKVFPAPRSKKAA